MLSLRGDMFLYRASLLLSILIATGPNKPFGIHIHQVVDNPADVFVMIRPKMAIPVNFLVTCERIVLAFTPVDAHTRIRLFQESQLPGWNWQASSLFRFVSNSSSQFSQISYRFRFFGPVRSNREAKAAAS